MCACVFVQYPRIQLRRAVFIWTDACVLQILNLEMAFFYTLVSNPMLGTGLAANIVPGTGLADNLVPGTGFAANPVPGTGVSS